jgi:hypothetical protein
MSRVFGLIEKKKMKHFLMEFAAWFVKKCEVKEEVIALDCKRIKGSDVHMLHVFATRLGIVLARVDLENKNNENVEIPAILDNLEIEGAIITADALLSRDCKRIREKRKSNSRKDRARNSFLYFKYKSFC